MTNTSTNTASAFDLRIRRWIYDEVNQSRVSLREAAETVKGMGLSSSAVESVLEEMILEQAENHVIPEAVMGSEKFERWYTGARSGGQWERYQEALVRKKSPGLETLDAETDSITSLLTNPNGRRNVSTKRKGLVMGNVQSGKTRNFAGVIAKAVDEGYKFVIVLSGMHNNLREQTQTRLHSDLFAGGEWYQFTNKNNDFEVPLTPIPLFVELNFLSAVVKKNSSRLAKLVKMMELIPLEIRRKCPVLIIDDEADQATPNSQREKDRISAINKHLRALWKTVEIGTYVAYTATPFANILIDPDEEDDLFPSDFITSIEPGEGYFGAERVFGVSDTVSEGVETDGLDMVRVIPTTEAAVLRPPSSREDRETFAPDLPASLCDALHWFIIATAIRRVRGQSEQHSSMLVHTTHYKDPHFAMKHRLAEYRDLLLANFEESTQVLFEQSWRDEAYRVRSETTLGLQLWEEVFRESKTVLHELKFIVDNGESVDRLNYEEDGQPQIVVAVGGGTLSRGLTLEGLAVSYFTRTSNTYDTLLQMGRWFGYRTGYEDLPRVWVAAGLENDYAHLARVEKDLRIEIASMQGSEYTPGQLGVRIRTHPGRLEITARNKQFSAEIVQLGLSGTSNQTFLLDGTPHIVQKNIAAASDLVAGANFSLIQEDGARWLAENVGGDQVSRFIQKFKAHEDQKWLSDQSNRAAMVNWIQEWAKEDIWNVVLVGRNSSLPAAATQTIIVGGQSVNCLQRTPMKNSTIGRVDLKALTSQPDRIADIDSALYKSDHKVDINTEVGRRRIRRLYGEGKGLILLYPLGSNAAAPEGLGERMNMPTENPMIGFAIVFPHVDDSNGEEGTFVSVRRNWDVPEFVEGDEDLSDEDDVMEGSW